MDFNLAPYHLERYRDRLNNIPNTRNEFIKKIKGSYIKVMAQPDLYEMFFPVGSSEYSCFLMNFYLCNPIDNKKTAAGMLLKVINSGQDWSSESYDDLNYNRQTAFTLYRGKKERFFASRNKKHPLSVILSSVLELPDFKQDLTSNKANMINFFTFLFKRFKGDVTDHPWHYEQDKISIKNLIESIDHIELMFIALEAANQENCRDVMDNLLSTRKQDNLLAKAIGEAANDQEGDEIFSLLSETHRLSDLDSFIPNTETKAILEHHLANVITKSAASKKTNQIIKLLSHALAPPIDLNGSPEPTRLNSNQPMPSPAATGVATSVAAPIASAHASDDLPFATATPSAPSETPPPPIPAVVATATAAPSAPSETPPPLTTAVVATATAAPSAPSDQTSFVLGQSLFDAAELLQPDQDSSQFPQSQELTGRVPEQEQKQEQEQNKIITNRESKKVVAPEAAPNSNAFANKAPKTSGSAASSTAAQPENAAAEAAVIAAEREAAAATTALFADVPLVPTHEPTVAAAKQNTSAQAAKQKASVPG